MFTDLITVPWTPLYDGLRCGFSLRWLTKYIISRTHDLTFSRTRNRKYSRPLYLQVTQTILVCGLLFLLWQWLISTRKYLVHCCISVARLSMTSQTDTVSHRVQAACFLHMSHQISFRHWKTLHTLAKLRSQTITLTQNWSFPSAHFHSLSAETHNTIKELYFKFQPLSNIRIQREQSDDTHLNIILSSVLSESFNDITGRHTVTQGIECGGCVYEALLLSKKLSLTMLHSLLSMARQSSVSHKRLSISQLKQAQSSQLSCLTMAN